MKKFILAAVFLASASSLTLASDIHDKVMSDLPGVTGRGVTSTPTARLDDGSLSSKVMHDTVGVTGPGRTTQPTARQLSGSLADKASRDLLGASL